MHQHREQRGGGERSVGRPRQRVAAAVHSLCDPQRGGAGRRRPGGAQRGFATRSSSVSGRRRGGGGGPVLSATCEGNTANTAMTQACGLMRGDTCGVDCRAAGVLGFFFLEAPKAELMWCRRTSGGSGGVRSGGAGVLRDVSRLDVLSSPWRGMETVGELCATKQQGGKSMSLRPCRGFCFGRSYYFLMLCLLWEYVAVLTELTNWTRKAHKKGQTLHISNHRRLQKVKVYKL